MTSSPMKRIAIIQISVAELIDRVTILRLKARHIDQPGSYTVEKQLHAYVEELQRLNVHDLTLDLQRFLERVNGMLWHLESDIRSCETEHSFGTRFICISRMIRRLNDRRSQIKSRIDGLCQSEFQEVKRYT